MAAPIASFAVAVKAPTGPKAPAGFHWVKDHWERNVAAVPVPAAPAAAADGPGPGLVTVAPADTIFGFPRKFVLIGGAALVGLVVYLKMRKKS